MTDASLTSLVADLFATIQLLSGYAPPTVPPEIHQVSHSVIQQRFCNGPCQIKAYYDPTHGVYIDETLDVVNDDLSRSILFHELVHHAQAVSGRFDLMSSDCVRHNTVEAEAYALQNRYLIHINAASRVSMNGWAARCAESEVPTPKRR